MFFQVFAGNQDADTVVKLNLNPPVETRFVRLLPLLWKNTPCLRMELYGCKFGTKRTFNFLSCVLNIASFNILLFFIRQRTAVSRTVVHFLVKASIKR